MPTGDLAGDPLRVAAFIGDAKKADLVGFLAQCGELHAGALPALRTAAGYYGMVQPLRAAAALAAHKRGADPPLDRWVSCAATTSPLGFRLPRRSSSWRIAWIFGGG